jgi:cell division protein FtsI (penicillin-binding protein 3)
VSVAAALAGTLGAGPGAQKSKRAAKSPAKNAGAGAEQSVRNLKSVRSLTFASSPLLASPVPLWRSRFLLVMLALAFSGLLGRALYLQVVKSAFLQAKGEEKFIHTETLVASRGRVLDRNGQLLATSVLLYSVQVTKPAFGASQEQRAQLAKILKLPLAAMNKRLDGAAKSLVLKRHLEKDEWEQVKALNIAGLTELREFKRLYPQGEAVSHLVGFTGVDPKAADTDEDVGRAGAEQAFEAQLQGTDGERTMVRSRHGNVVENVGEPLLPENGRDLALSIDSRVQSFAWQRLTEAVRSTGAKEGSVVVMDAQTGEVLALANYPSYDPNLLSARQGEKMRNIGIASQFEPGSTMKPFTMALALERGVVNPGSVVDTSPGSITIADRTIKDTHVYGVLSMAQVIQKSSNVGTIKTALRMPASELFNVHSAVGLGRHPSLGFPEKEALPGQAKALDKAAFPGGAKGVLRQHRTGSVQHASMSYGYAMSASLLQMAQAYTVFAREGEFVPATLVKRADSNGAPVPGTRVFSAKTANQVRDMLGLAVAAGGTGPEAQVNTLGYSVGGKTGTTRVNLEKVGYTSKHRAFFVGLAPLKNPRLVVAVMVDSPQGPRFHGGEVAAPLFGKVTQYALGLLAVPADLDVQSQVKAGPVAAAAESN